MNIRRVVLPLVASLAVTAGATQALAAPPQSNIVQLVQAANAPGGAFEGQFDTLLAAVLVADPDVVATLAGRGYHTVFGPTDDAFAAAGLDESNIATVDQTALTEILLYHVAQGRLAASAVVSRERIRMISGGALSVNGTVLTDNVGRQANIIVTDVRASNGIVHAIDAVVLPFAL